MANKNPLEIIKRPVAYASGYENIPTKAQDRAIYSSTRIQCFLSWNRSL